MFCVCSIAVYIEELTKAKQPFERLTSGLRQTALNTLASQLSGKYPKLEYAITLLIKAKRLFGRFILTKAKQSLGCLTSGHQQSALDALVTHSNAKYPETESRIVFFGAGPQRKQACKRVLGDQMVTWQQAGIDIYKIQPDRTVASVAPDLGLRTDDERTHYVSAILKRATAVVLVVDPNNKDSITYAEELKGLQPGQPVLLVSYRERSETSKDKIKELQVLAVKNHWAFATKDDIIVAYRGLQDKMRVYMRDGPQILETLPSSTEPSGLEIC